MPIFCLVITALMTSSMHTAMNCHAGLQQLAYPLSS